MQSVHVLNLPKNYLILGIIRLMAWLILRPVHKLQSLPAEPNDLINGFMQ